MHKIFKPDNVILSDSVITLNYRPASLESIEESIAETVNPQIALDIIEKANDQADEILKEAYSKASTRENSIIKQAKEQAVEIKSKAFSDGFTEGFQNATLEKYSDIEQNINALYSQMQMVKSELASFSVEYEKNLKLLAIDITSKVLHKKIDADDMIMADLVTDTIDSIKNTKWISVSVSEEMVRLLSFLEDEVVIATAHELAIDILPIEAPKGTCIVESENGVVDASVWEQLENLKDYFMENR